MYFLNEEFASNFGNEDPYLQLQAMDGKIYRQVKNRKTFQFTHKGSSYFAKLHSGVGWLEILKNLLNLRRPILGARNEWEAIHKLQELNIATMTAVAYGESGWNPARRQSFIVTEELTDTISLEDYCMQWRESEPNWKIKRALIERVASIASSLHSNGICHRDFYLCHFLLHKNEENFPKLSLIDLHRALVKSNLARRWVIKDIAGLLYSAKTIGLNQRELLRFVRHYHGKDLRAALKDNKSFWMDVEKRANSMFEKLGPAF